MRKFKIMELVLGIFVLLLIVLLILVIIASVVDFPIVAVSADETSIALFDFWSIGHVLVGIGFFSVPFSIIYFIIKKSDIPKPPPTTMILVGCMIFTVVIAFLWEFIENVILYAVGCKSKLDSLVNGTTDIIVWVIGGLGSWYMTHLMFVSERENRYHIAYNVYLTINLLLGLLLFIVFNYLTMKL